MSILARLFEKEWKEETEDGYEYHRGFFVDCIISTPKVPSPGDPSTHFKITLGEDHGYGIRKERDDVRKGFPKNKKVVELPEMLEELEKVKKKVLSELPFDEGQAKWVSVHPPQDMLEDETMIVVYSVFQLCIV